MPHDLGQFGDEPHIPFHFNHLEGTSVLGMPDGGYVAQLTKGSPLAPLVDALAAHLRVPVESLNVGYEGHDIDPSLAINNQGFSDPTPSSVWLRRGRKVELIVTLESGVKTGTEIDKADLQQQKAEEEVHIKTVADNLLKAVKTEPPDIKSIEQALAVAMAEDAKLIDKHVNMANAQKKLEQLKREERSKLAQSNHDKRLEENQKKLRLRRDALHLQLVAPPQEERDALLDLAPTPAAAFQWVRDTARKKHEAAMNAQAARAGRLGFEDGEFERTLAYVRERAPLIIHCDFTKYGEKIAKDTHYRNLFEIGTGNGCTNQSVRASQEDDIFGKKYHASKAFDRPKYGVLNFTNDPMGVSGCYQYGKDYVLLKRARLRTSLTSEDSFGSAGKNLGTTDYYAHIFQQYKDEEFKEAIQIGCNRKPLQDGKTHVTYKEIQIHGEINLSQHVAALVVHSDRRSLLKDGSSKFGKTLEDLQIACGLCPVYWTDDMDDMIAVATISKDRGVEDWSEEPGRLFDEVKRGILAPRAAPPRVDDLPEVKEEEREQICASLKRHVLDIETKLSSSKRPCMDSVLQTCDEGIPAYSENPLFFAKTLRDLFAAFNKSDADGSVGAAHRMAVLNDLVKAFQSPEALLARTIEKYSSEVSGSLFERQIKGFVAEKKEGALDEVILELRPDSDRTDITVKEEEQFAHIVNAFRQHHQIGLTGIKYGKSDRLQKDLSDVEVRTARKRYMEELDIMGMVDEIVHDINQPSASLNRRFDVKALEEWAKENLPQPKDIYWDDSRTWLYMQVQPDVVQEKSERSHHPWIDRMSMLEILHKVLACR